MNIDLHDLAIPYHYQFKSSLIMIIAVPLHFHYSLDSEIVQSNINRRAESK